MKNEKEINEKLQKLIQQLPDAGKGMPAHLIREKIRLLRWVLE